MALLRAGDIGLSAMGSGLSMLGRLGSCSHRGGLGHFAATLSRETLLGLSKWAVMLFFCLTNEINKMIRLMKKEFQNALV